MVTTEYRISRTEKKRRAKEIESLSQELATLPPADLARLPCDDFLREEIRLIAKLKGSSRKRQVKYIAKELRQQPVDEILAFLEERKGSRLGDSMAHRELERLRNDIIAEAIDQYNDREEEGFFTMDRQASPLLQAQKMFPDLDIESIAKAADNFAVNRRVTHSREIFKTLKASAERLKFTNQGD
jgi:ribosome-associated protein